MNAAEIMPWILAILLGVGLSAASGLKTFLPLLMLAVAARLHLAGITLSGPMMWLASDAALAALTIATIVEVVGDAVPVVDHALDTLGTVARPAAGWLATAAALGMAHADPATAAIIGLIIGAPTAFALHGAKSTTRAASTTTTLGMANPVLSIVEDVAAFGLSLISLLVPLLVPIALGFVAWVVWRVVKAIRVARGRLTTKKS